MQKILSLIALVGVAAACPFKDFGDSIGGNFDCSQYHSKELCDTLKTIAVKGESRSQRKLLGAPGYPPLPEPEVSLKNNGFRTPSLVTSLMDGMDLIDMVAQFSGRTGIYASASIPDAVAGRDMCIWSFQSLPPPPGPDAQYKIPATDAVRAVELCNQANDKWQSEIGTDKHDGAIVFGGCTLGSRGAKEVCDFDIDDLENARYCKFAAQTSSIVWPNAVTMVKVRAANGTGSENAVLKEFMRNWRNKVHLNHRKFVNEGGTGSIHGSTVAGWGAGGGPDINRKIVPCDIIDPKFMYPAPFPPAALNSNGTKTLMDEAYEFWQAIPICIHRLFGAILFLNIRAIICMIFKKKYV